MAVDDTAAAETAAELVRQYAPEAPADVRATAAALVEVVLEYDANGAGAAHADLREGGSGASYRDPMRADIVRRSGAAGILAPWRRPRARPIAGATA